MKRLILVVALAPLVTTQAPSASDPRHGFISSFRPIATFVVPDRNSAEIISATPDGRTLVYSDAIGNTIGIVDITDPQEPVQKATIDVDGQPTSVAVTPDGKYAVVAVRKAEFDEDDPLTPPFQTPPPGELWLLNLEQLGPPIVYPIAAGPNGEIGYLPDSVALAQIRGALYAVVALENEPIVLVRDGATYFYFAPEPPGLPHCPATAVFEFEEETQEGCDLSDAGFVQIVKVTTTGAPGLQFTANVAFPASALGGLLYPDDAQPEHVARRGSRAAVTLQENNGVAVIDLSTPSAPTAEVFSTGIVETRRADLLDDATINFGQFYPDDALAAQPQAGTRIPDGIAWNDEGSVLLTANEGELAFTGGRGWTVWTSNGGLLWDDEGSLEATAVTRAQYPDGRSDAKGIETEGVTTGVFDGKEFAFVTSERGSFVAVYRLNANGKPHFVQLLPTGIGPESVLAIPSRDLVITANEGDEGDGTISIFKGIAGIWDGTREQPQLESSFRNPWGALSGFAADLQHNRRLFAVPDNALPSSVFEILFSGSQARVRTLLDITKDGAPKRYDLEGIAIDTSIQAPRWRAGFWLAHEGNALCDPDEFEPNLLIQIDSWGRVIKEIPLPDVIEPAVPCIPSGNTQVRPPGTIASNGFEGVAVSSNGRYLVVAIQRPFTGEAPSSGATHTRIGKYDLRTGAWSFYAYPLFVSASATIGLSEITLLNTNQFGEDVYAVIERDNRYGARATFKRVYKFILPTASCAAGATITDCATSGALISKTLFEDILEQFFPYEKVESLAITRHGDVWVGLDNDGGEVEARVGKIRDSGR